LKKLRLFLVLLCVFIMCFGTVYPAFAAGADIKLENHPNSLHVDLMSALMQRQSTRSGFTSQKIPVSDLSTILWAANGINRKNNQRTAPTALGKYFIDIYVAANEGVYKYNPAGNLLKWVSASNIKTNIGTQPDIGTASHVLIFVADLRVLPPVMERAAKLDMANGTAGTIAENVYLTAAALKLGTRLVASIKENNIREALQLNKDEVPLYIMPLGYSK
jgi:SagB-type dehydrogenase family enzyme